MKKRILSMFLSAIIIFIIIMSPIQGNVMVAAAASDKTKVKTTVNNYFKAAKKYDVKKMNKYVKNTDDYDPSELYAYSAFRNYIKTRNKSLNYSVQKVAVKGSNATVTVKCKYLDSSKTYEQAFTNLLLFAIINYDKDYSEKELLREFNTIFKLTIKDNKSAYAKKYKTKTFKIKLVKEKGSWKINKMTYDLANSVTANFYKAANSIFSD
ncbi:nuclear transport factor 2 family protein [Konateibacter massiliensis]|uniref:nuclear transport factor 2 family protein n=1 Tax=Konateibacter massiliensis TaxID=2002841 RepID=UPI000C15F954|nr:nuclear transport factor 2 family protein [Konateibacter massiliensis]